jgi:hypothetical protein
VGGLPFLSRIRNHALPASPLGRYSSSWSSDGESLLFSSGDGGEWCFRMRVRDGRIERIANLKKMRVAGWWFAAAPNNSFINAVDSGTEEIFALDWKAP